MSDVLPPIEPETSGQVTQLDVGQSNVGLKVAAVLVVALAVATCWWLFNSRNGDPKAKLKLPFVRFRSLFKNELTWRLFMVLQIAGFIGITYLAIANENNWHLFPYTRLNDEMDWDFFDSQFWTEHHENWLVVAFIIGPFLISKAIDWIFAAKRQTQPRDDWKNN